MVPAADESTDGHVGRSDDLGVEISKDQQHLMEGAVAFEGLDGGMDIAIVEVDHEGVHQLGEDIHRVLGAEILFLAGSPAGDLRHVLLDERQRAPAV